MSSEGPTGGAEGGPVVASTPEAATLESALRMRGRSFCSGCRSVFGIPDYERYLAHAAERHPDLAVLPRREFFAQSIDRKYGKGGMRCC